MILPTVLLLLLACQYGRQPRAGPQGVSPRFLCMCGRHSPRLVRLTSSAAPRTPSHVSHFTHWLSRVSFLQKYMSEVSVLPNAPTWRRVGSSQTCLLSDQNNGKKLLGYVNRVELVCLLSPTVPPVFASCGPPESLSQTYAHVSSLSPYSWDCTVLPTTTVSQRCYQPVALLALAKNLSVLDAAYVVFLYPIGFLNGSPCTTLGTSTAVRLFCFERSCHEHSSPGVSEMT